MGAQALKVHQVCAVAPPQETSPTSLPLTVFDITLLRRPPVQRLFFYNFPNDSTISFFDSVFPTLKHSLSLTLQHFLPLAGNIIWPHDSPHPTITYLPGDAVSLTVAESNADFNILSSDFCQLQQRHPLVPPLKTSHEKTPVLALQLTLLPNSGYSIGITTHHGAFDGISSMLFIKAWALVCSNILKHHQNSPTPSSSISLPENLTPFFDRSVIRDPSGMREAHVKELLNHGGETNNRSLEVVSANATQHDAVKGLFVVTPSQIKKLKQYAESKIENNKVRLSSFSVTYAYLLHCAVKVVQPKSDRVAFGYGVDCRPRLDPPIKPTYFGNCLAPHVVVAETRQVLSDDGFINALVGITDVLSTLKFGGFNVEENWRRMMQSGAMNCTIFSITGSPRFEVYGVDFGWGRPKKVDTPSVHRTGAFSLSESRDRDGGIEFGLALNKAQMEAFAEVFAQGLLGLNPCNGLMKVHSSEEVKEELN